MNGIFFRNKELSKFMNDGGSIVGQVCPLSSTPNERNWVLLLLFNFTTCAFGSVVGFMQYVITLEKKNIAMVVLSKSIRSDGIIFSTNILSSKKSHFHEKSLHFLGLSSIFGWFFLFYPCFSLFNDRQWGGDQSGQPTLASTTFQRRSVLAPPPRLRLVLSSLPIESHLVGKSFTKWPTPHYHPDQVQLSGSIWQTSDRHAKCLHRHQARVKYSPIQKLPQFSSFSFFFF